MENDTEAHMDTKVALEQMKDRSARHWKESVSSVRQDAAVRS